jgi:hypothetical protein
MHYSIISPQMVDIGAQSPSNEHTERLAGILLTYNFYEKKLGSSFLARFMLCCSQFANQGNEGYVQGMSDLCAPIYVVMGAEEEMTFWCFTEVMSRMVSTWISAGFDSNAYLDAESELSA